MLRVKLTSGTVNLLVFSRDFLNWVCFYAPPSNIGITLFSLPLPMDDTSSDNRHLQSCSV